MIRKPKKIKYEELLDLFTKQTKELEELKNEMNEMKSFLAKETNFKTKKALLSQSLVTSNYATI